MINLTGPGGYAAVFAIAAISGLLGGLAAELLLNRNGETGSFEQPSRRDGLWDFGGFSNLMVGAVVGLAILAVVQPETIVTTDGAGATSTVRAYDAIRLVATAIIAGSAGGSVLTALQTSALAALNENRVQSTVAASEQELEHLATVAKVTTSAAFASPAPAGTARPRGLRAGQPGDTAGQGSTEMAIDEMVKALDRQVEEGKAAVAAAAAPRR